MRIKSFVIFALIHILISASKASTPYIPVQINVAIDTLSTSTNDFRSKIIYKARDSIKFDISGKYITLYGNASLEYDDILILADYIQINQELQTIFAKGVLDSLGRYSGKPILKESNNADLESDSVIYNFKSRRAKGWSVYTAEGEGFIKGGEIKLDSNRVGYLRRGIYTTCNNPDHPHYGISISRAKVTENRIVTGPANLFIEGVPLPIGLPFGFFPKTSKRANGILFPRIGEDISLGFFAADGGYYLGLSDNFDLTLRGSIYANTSYGISISSRYNFLYKSTGNIAIAYNNRKLGEKNSPDFAQTKDFNIRWTHSQQQRARNATFNANVNIGTSSFFRNPIGEINFNDITRNNLSSSVSYSKSWRNTPFNLASSLSHRQELTSGDISLSLPVISFNMARIQPFESKNRIGAQKWFHKIGLSYSLDAENQINTKDSLLFKPETIKNFRNGIRHTIPIGTSFTLFKHFFFSPGANYVERWYFQTIRKQFDGSNLRTDTVQEFRTSREYDFSVSMNTRIYGQANFKGKIQAIRHVVTLNTGFAYKPDFGKPQFGYFKQVQADSTGRLVDYSIFEQTIYGGPSRGLSKSIFFGIDNSLEAKIKSKKDTISGIKKIVLLEGLGINGSYNFAADSFRLSPINISGRTTLFEKLGITFGGQLDPYAIDNNGVRRNTYLFKESSKLARLTQAFFSLDINLNSRSKRNNRTLSPIQQQELNFINPIPGAFVDFNIPWNVNFSFTYGFSNFGLIKQTSAIANFSGDLNITNKWKVGYFSGYDFITNQLSNTQFSVYRDLHCWDLSFSWVPFGTFQSYSVDLKVKSSILQDLKLSKRRAFFNN